MTARGKLQKGLMPLYPDDRRTAERKMLALDALSKLAHEFSSKPDFHKLITTLLLTLSGQFSVSNLAAILKKQDSFEGDTIYLATGKFRKNQSLKSLKLSSDLGKYFSIIEGTGRVSEISDNILESSLGTVLQDSGVELLCPLIHNDGLLGIICLGGRVKNIKYEKEDIELLNTLVNTITPLISGAYHFWEMASQSAWYLSILDNVQQGVFVFDNDYCLKKLNKSAFEILRAFNPRLAHQVALHHQTIHDVFKESVFGDWSKRCIKLIKEKNKGTLENIRASASDQQRMYDAFICRILGDENFDGDILITLNDITERKNAEEHERNLQEKLQRAERMESLGILAGGVAHDLNNMLGPLVGYPELMLLRLPKDSPLRNQVEKMGASARDAANVVQDLLTLARRGRYEMVPTNINNVINSYLDSPAFANLLQLHPDVKVNTRLDESSGNILGSSAHLSKVFMNLIMNAFDAMPEGGELLIETACRHLDRLPGGHEKIERGNYVMVRIGDTGQGIEEKDLERIFEPYYSKKKMAASGSGLGLAVVYGILKDHKGYYDIVSKVGKGTEFILYFPVTSEEAGCDQSIEDFSGNEKILVVDDVPEQREIAGELLSSLGYKVESCNNGHEAIQFLNKNKADIVVLDMIMEKDFDGLDTYREIIKMQPGQKAVIVSGFSITERVEQMQELGAGPYIRKPFSREQLGKAVRDELDRPVVMTAQ